MHIITNCLKIFCVGASRGAMLTSDEMGRVKLYILIPMPLTAFESLINDLLLFKLV